MNNNSEISTRIRETRELAKENLSEFARRIEVPRSTLVGYENGSTIPASILHVIAKRYNMSEEWLVSGVGERKKQPPKQEQLTEESRKNSLLLTKMADKKLEKQPFTDQNGHQKAEKTASATERQTDEKMTSQPFDEQNGQENGCQINLSYQNSKSSNKQETLPFACQNGQPKSKEANLSTDNASHRQDRNLTYYPEQSDFSASGPDSGAPNYHTPLPVVHEAADGVVIPLLEQAVSAGRGKELREDDRPALYLNIPSEYGKYGALYALPVRGDSMYPTLDEGDLVVCDSGGWDGDGIYVIKSQDCAFVKRVALSSKGYTVISDNAAYPAYSESKEDIAIVGKVRCAVVRFK